MAAEVVVEVDVHVPAGVQAGAAGPPPRSGTGAVAASVALALVWHDLIEDHPRRVTAGWVYERFHGEGYGGGYSPQFLTAEAARLRAHLDAGRDVYVYFNNDLGGHAVHDALALRRYLGAAGE